MKLHKNQLALIRHLILLNIMAYADCLTFLDTENTGDRIAMSYAFRSPVFRRAVSCSRRKNL